MSEMSSQSLPENITKNWVRKSVHSSTFVNIKTGQEVHEYFEVPLPQNKIALIEQRAQTKDPFVCRVRYYYQTRNGYFNIYTDETGYELSVQDQQDYN